MEALFITVFNMSITAGVIAIAVIALRFLLKKTPKWIMDVLWAFVAIRLIFPFSFESAFSLIPNAEIIPQDIFTAKSPEIKSAIPIMLNQAANPPVPAPASSVGFALFAVWLAGTLAMLAYMLVSFCRIRMKTREAVQSDGNIMLCDSISSPFILGVFKPRIYLPSLMNSAYADYVLSHERAHLKRMDHIKKPAAFLLLCIHWFNPIIWVAYILLCRDIELACDEKVIRSMGTKIKKPYSEALINCSVPRRTINACPLAFGEANINERVKNVLNYKKPTLWIIIAAIAVCAVTAVCLLTNPKSDENTPPDNTPAVENSDVSTTNDYEKELDDLKKKKDELEAELSALTEERKQENERLEKEKNEIEKEISEMVKAGKEEMDALEKEISELQKLKNSEKERLGEGLPRLK